MADDEGAGGGDAEAHGGADRGILARAGAWLWRFFFDASPPTLLVWWFGGLILLGAVVLSLPWCHALPEAGADANRAGGGVSPFEALFTATSAVCVTGLIVVDTATAFNRLGQTVILVLIQLGGLGVMTFAGLALQLLGERLPFAHQAALEDAFFQRNAAHEFRRAFFYVVKLVFAIEALAVLPLTLGLWSATGGPHELFTALFSAVFHSVSAFCNAGFSIYSDSLIGLRDNGLVLWTLIALIILGGIGHGVLVEVARLLLRRGRGAAAWLGLARPKAATVAKASETDQGKGHPVVADRSAPPTKLGFNSRVALLVTAALLVGGTLGLLAMDGVASAEGAGAVARSAAEAPDVPDAPGGPGGLGRAGFAAGALFQSVTARTAGFNTVDLAALGTGPLLLLIGLMFVGGSPGSCAGGVKTTTLAVWLASIRASLRGRPAPVLLGRSIGNEIVRRMTLLINLGLWWNLGGIVLLTLTEGAPLRDVVFEQVSAFATVGLSTGLTPDLSAAGRIWIIATMFVGRLGPLTIALWAVPPARERIHYPNGRVMIG